MDDVLKVAVVVWFAVADGAEVDVVVVVVESAVVVVDCEINAVVVADSEVDEVVNSEMDEVVDSKANVGSEMGVGFVVVFPG